MPPKGNPTPTINATAVNTISSAATTGTITTINAPGPGQTGTLSAQQPNNTITSTWTSTNISDIIDMADDMENAVQIDITEIDKDSTETATRMVRDMEGLYYDDEWLATHPRIKKRIDIELESLRSLIKLRKSNEQAHDAILNGISSNNTNASLYRSLAEIQRTSLAVTKQINETVHELEDILQQYQMATDAPVMQEMQQEEDDISMHRGSKSFIKEQIKKSDE